MNLREIKRKKKNKQVKMNIYRTKQFKENQTEGFTSKVSQYYIDTNDCIGIYSLFRW